MRTIAERAEDSATHLTRLEAAAGPPPEVLSRGRSAPGPEGLRAARSAGPQPLAVGWCGISTAVASRGSGGSHLGSKCPAPAAASPPQTVASSSVAVAQSPPVTLPSPTRCETGALGTAVLWRRRRPYSAWRKGPTCHRAPARPQRCRRNPASLPVWRTNRNTQGHGIGLRPSTPGRARPT
jgi:hypothetical protein